jgi:hypothetical protein
VAQRRWPKRHDIIQSHRQTVERVRKADIAHLSESSAGGGPIAGVEMQMAVDTAPGASPLAFGEEIWADGGHYSDSKFYPDSQGLWVAWCHLQFFGDAPTGNGVLEIQLRFSDSSDQYLVHGTSFPMYFAGSSGGGYDFGQGTAVIGPVLIDDRYSAPYFHVLGTVQRISDAGGTPSGHFLGFPDPSESASRMGIYRVG